MVIIFTYFATACSVTPSVNAPYVHHSQPSVSRELPHVTRTRVQSRVRPKVIKKVVTVQEPKLIQKPRVISSRRAAISSYQKKPVLVKAFPKKTVIAPRRQEPVPQLVESPYDSIPKDQVVRRDNKVSTELSATQGLIVQARKSVANKQYSPAISYLERALRIEPQNAAIWSELAKVHYEKGSDARAISMARKSNLYSPEGSALELQNWEIIKMASKRSGNVQALKDALRYERLRS